MLTHSPSLLLYHHLLLHVIFSDWHLQVCAHQTDHVLRQVRHWCGVSISIQVFSCFIFCDVCIVYDVIASLSISFIFFSLFCAVLLSLDHWDKSCNKLPLLNSLLEILCVVFCSLFERNMAISWSKFFYTVVWSSWLCLSVCLWCTAILHYVVPCDG